MSRADGDSVSAGNSSVPVSGSAHGGDFVPPRDALLREPALPHMTQLSILGVWTRLMTNERRVLEMFEHAFGPALTDDERGDEQARQLEDEQTPLQLTVQVVIYEEPEEPVRNEAVRHICPDSARVLMVGRGGMAISDPARREALLYATSSLVGDETRFRYEFLEAATLALVTHFDRQPIHAAAITEDGRAVLLMGPSGAGKSTLAYLAQSAGLEVLSEDIVWMQLKPAVGIWGRPHTIHLLPGSDAHFPELEHNRAVRQPNGKRKMSVPMSDSQALRSAFASRVSVCLLEPGSDSARLTRVEREELHVALMQDPAAGFDRYPERRAECAELLAAGGGWRLGLTGNPRDALPLLKRLLHMPVPAR